MIFILSDLKKNSHGYILTINLMHVCKVFLLSFIHLVTKEMPLIYILRILKKGVL